MFKLFKKLDRKDVFFVLISVALIAFQVWLDLKLPDYMSNIICHRCWLFGSPY